MYVSTVTSSTKQYLATSYRHSVSIDIVATLYPFSRLLCLYHLYRQNVIGRHEINIHSIISAILKWYDTVSEAINYYMFLRKLLNIVTLSYTIQYTELFNSSWVKYTCIHVRLKMDQDHPSFKYMYSVLINYMYLWGWLRVDYFVINRNITYIVTCTSELKLTPDY